MNELGKRIEERRDRLDMTQRDLAEASDITVNYVKAIESGRQYPGLGVLASICKALRVQPGQLLDSKPEPMNSPPIDSLVTYLRARRCTDEDVRRLEAVARAMFSTRP